MEEKTKHRIGTIAIIVLVISALICDLIGLIPFAKDFTATIFWGIASFYFWKNGMGLFNGRKLATMAISWVSGMIPFIQEIPIELTAGIIAIIIITRVEEKTGMSLTEPMKKGIMPAAMYKDGKRLPWDVAKPLNEGGIRNSGATVNVTTQRDDLVDKENEKYTSRATTNNLSTSSYSFGNGGQIQNQLKPNMATPELQQYSDVLNEGFDKMRSRADVEDHEKRLEEARQQVINSAEKRL